MRNTIHELSRVLSRQVWHFLDVIFWGVFGLLIVWVFLEFYVPCLHAFLVLRLELSFLISHNVVGIHHSLQIFLLTHARGILEFGYFKEKVGVVAL